eukprot:CAMPEP_0198285260 /NCGR_PEP_ID=MMETSP1449-20131203/4587_1 /TAXON_ID=420275 /ORGANISM="Attheya septentrionalis, Strain CCMP2084" /LENGTH=488 /DNA_ID=CAMNT_0043982619 /DNA_START=106 /DNA_END=1572 /DNA_ORIENTATION=+
MASLKPMQVTVTDPIESGEGRTRTTTYRVDIRGDIPGSIKSPEREVTSSGSNFAFVRRRYSDFQWLYTRLNVERPGAIIPIIPHKMALKEEKRFSDELVEDRREHLETFLKKVLVHPELLDTHCLSTFLRCEDDTFEAAKKERDAEFFSADGSIVSQELPVANNGAQRKEKIRTMFAKRGVRIKSRVSGGKNLQGTADEDTIQELETYTSGLEVLLKSLCQEAISLSKHKRDTAKTIHALGNNILALPLGRTHESEMQDDESEQEAAQAVFMLRHIQSTSENIADMLYVSADQDSSEFEKSMEDLKRTVSAIKAAMKKRHDAQILYTTRLKQISFRQNVLDKVRNPPGSSTEEKIYQCEMELRAAEQGADQARDELHIISKRILREVERVKKEMHDHVREMMMLYAKLQIAHNSQMEGEWAKLMPHLMSFRKGDNESGATAPNSPPPREPPPLPPSSSLEDATEEISISDSRETDITETDITETVEFI